MPLNVFEVEAQVRPDNTSWLASFKAVSQNTISNIRQSVVNITNIGNIDTVQASPFGYPQFSALLGAHPDFSLSRRFSVARARLLLIKQNRVAELERELQVIDTDEQRPLYLASIQIDANEEREKVLGQLEQALAEYDELLERNARILRLRSASAKNVKSLQNWLRSTGSIDSTETDFLNHPDLCAVGDVGDSGFSFIESRIESAAVILIQVFSKLLKRQKPGPRIFVFNSHTTRGFTFCFLTAFVVSLLLIPLSFMRSVQSVSLQMLCIIGSSGFFIVVLSGPLGAKPSDVFGAAATYAALLAMFLSSRNENQVSNNLAK